MSPDQIQAWTIARLRGDDSMPLLYGGKEEEFPHEAIAAALGLEQETLTPEKRSAIIKGLRTIRRAVQEEFIDDAISDDSVIALARRWAEVVDRAQPPELANDARSLLDDALRAKPMSQSALPYLAAAAGRYAADPTADARLWHNLLELPETAALAFRKCLTIDSTDELAQHWIELYKKRLEEGWSTNMRLLTAALLEQSKDLDALQSATVRLIRKSHLAAKIQADLTSSRNPSIKCFVQRLGLRGAIDEAFRAFLADILPERFSLASEFADYSDYSTYVSEQYGKSTFNYWASILPDSYILGTQSSYRANPPFKQTDRFAHHRSVEPKASLHDTWRDRHRTPISEAESELILMED